MKKTKLEANGSEFNLSSIDVINALDYTKDCMVRYGVYTIEDRAIPDYRDGCKPVHRRILWTAFKMGLTHDKPTTKCARIVGSCLGHYHPHGSSGVYDGVVTMVSRMTEPMLHAQGNFGNKVTGDGPAAERYTESKLTKFSEEYLLDKDYLACVPMVSNYDGKELEPVYLPAKLPISLTQFVEGIATGAATLIPSFSLESLRKTVSLALKKGSVTAKMCYDNLEFAFTDGGFVHKEDELLEFFQTGKGDIWVYPYAHYDEKSHAVVMTSYVPRFKIESALESGLDIEGVTDVEDHTSTKSGVRILFKLKKSLTKKQAKQAVEEVQNWFAVKLPASIMVTERHDDGETVSFRYSSPTDIINDWLSWRIAFEKKVVTRLISLEKEKVNKFNWLLWALDHKDLVYTGLETKDPKGFLQKKGKITEEHAEFIYDLQLKRLSRLSEEQLKKDLKTSKQAIKDYKASIATDVATRKRILSQLKDN